MRARDSCRTIVLVSLLWRRWWRPRGVGLKRSEFNGPLGGYKVMRVREKRLTSGCYYQQKLSWEKCRVSPALQKRRSLFNTSGTPYFSYIFSPLSPSTSAFCLARVGKCPFNFANVVNRVNQTSKLCNAPYSVFNTYIYYT